MAQSPYDDSQDEQSKSLTPESLRRLEDRNSDHREASEHKEGSDDSEGYEHPGEKHVREEADKEKSLGDNLRNQWQQSKEDDNQPFRKTHDNQVGRGYQKGLPAPLRVWAGRNRKWLIGGGVAATGIIGIIIALFGALNLFKLDDLVSNIDARSFARLNGVEDRRSVSWMQAYMQMRLADIGDNPDLSKGTSSDNAFFRAESVNTGNPIFDWYRTLRTSKFEQEVFEKNGFKFVSYRNSQGKIRPAKIILNGNTIETLNLSAADWKNLENGNVATIRKYSDLVSLEKFDSDGSARKAIKQAVRNETQFYQVFKRRHVRKAIQNMTGVRDWRFFDGARTKVDEKKIDIRNKIIVAAVPESTKSGKFIRCLFGVSDCTFSEDPSSPENRAESTLLETAVKDGKPVTELGPDGKPVKAPYKVDLQPAVDTVKQLSSQILEKANVFLSATNVISTLDSISNINDAMQSGKLSKGIVVARGVQAMGLYQVFATSRDQMKSGDLNSAEFNQFMQVIGPIASSEGWTKVVNGDGNAANLTNTPESNFYCSQQNELKLAKDPSLAEKDKRFSFAYLCPDKQIGGSSKAASIEKTYNDTIGTVISPILSVYNDARKNTPIFSWVVDKALSLLNSITSTLTNIFLSITGLSGPIKDLVASLTSKLIAFLGAGPIMNGNEPAGQYMNWLAQGGAYTAEATSRANGANLTNPVSMAESRKSVIAYQQDDAAGMSISDKLFSLSNPKSLASKSTLAVSRLSLDSIRQSLLGFGSIFKPLAGLGFAHSYAAASDDGYRAADFAGIQTFDFPTKCYNLNPLLATPVDGTNIIDVMAKNGITIPPTDLTWDLVTNNDNWYSYMYSRLEKKTNADEIAEQIYNCGLLDNSVRGSLGYVFGYSKDNGLDDGSTAATTTATVVASGGPTPTTSSSDAKLVAQQILKQAKAGKIQFNVLNTSDILDGSTPEQNIQETAQGKPASTTTTCLGRGGIPPSPVVELNINLLNFILDLSQTQSIQINALAGQCHSSSSSNHYKGLAVDFGCPFNPFQADMIGAKYNIADKTGETCSNSAHYHYSVGGF